MTKVQLKDQNIIASLKPRIYGLKAIYSILWFITLDDFSTKLNLALNAQSISNYDISYYDKANQFRTVIEKNLKATFPLSVLSSQLTVWIVHQ